MPPTVTRCPPDPLSPAMGADGGSPWDTRWGGRLVPKALCSGDGAFLVGSATDQLVVATGRLSGVGSHPEDSESSKGKQTREKEDSGRSW